LIQAITTTQLSMVEMEALRRSRNVMVVLRPTTTDT